MAWAPKNAEIDEKNVLTFILVRGILCSKEINYDR